MFLAALVLIGLLAAVSSWVIYSENEARSKLRERFTDRTEVGATFVGVYMKEMLARESRIARRYLQADVTKNLSMSRTYLPINHCPPATGSPS